MLFENAEMRPIHQVRKIEKQGEDKMLVHRCEMLLQSKRRQIALCRRCHILHALELPTHSYKSLANLQ